MTDYRIQHAEEERGVFCYDKEHSRLMSTTREEFPRTWDKYQADLKRDYEAALQWLGRGYCAHKHTCATCGDEFYAKSPHARYCSRRCSNDAFFARRREYKALRRRKVCPVCQCQFVAKRNDGHYCSARCKQAAYRQRKAVTDTCSPEFCITQRRNNVTDTCLDEFIETQRRNAVVPV